MNESNDDPLDRKASKTKTVIFLAILGGLLLGGIILIQTINSSGSDDMMNNGAMPSTNQTEEPDPVKDSTGSNSDTMPSPTGTGPGSDNSLLSQ